MEFANLLCERRDNVLVVTLNRPQKLNSFSLGLLKDLRSCAEAIQRERGLRAVLLTGAGRGFCAGADLTDPEGLPGPGQSMGQLMGSRLRESFQRRGDALVQPAVPLVVGLNGVAAGAGASLALMGDITIGAKSASLAFVFAPKLGLVPDMGGSYFLARRIGEARAGRRADGSDDRRGRGDPDRSHRRVRGGRAVRVTHARNRRVTCCGTAGRVPRRARADGDRRHREPASPARGGSCGAVEAGRQP